MPSMVCRKFVITNLKLPDDECLILKYHVNTCFGYRDSSIMKKECSQTTFQLYRLRSICTPENSFDLPMPFVTNLDKHTPLLDPLNTIPFLCI